MVYTDLDQLDTVMEFYAYSDEKNSNIVEKTTNYYYQDGAVSYTTDSNGE